MDKTLLVNQAFALRQRDGLPVFTTIETEIIPHSQEFMEKYGIFEKMGYKLADRKRRIKTDHPIDLHKLERIIITPNAKGYISTFFLEFAKEHKIPIYWVDVRGRIEACFMPMWFVKPMTVIKQYEAVSNGKGVGIAKYLVKLKLESEGMMDLIGNLMRVKNIKSVLSIEGLGSTRYYKQWNFSKEWNWKGRRVSSHHNYATDPINACLNLGYGLLAQRMSEILLRRGFELSIGFLHANEGHDYYWNRLSFDFIEPYRVWIDNSVKDMVAEREIKPTDFTFAEDKSHMVFKDNALETALNRFMGILEPLEHKSLPVIRKVENML